MSGLLKGLHKGWIDTCFSKFKKEGTHILTGTRYSKTFGKMIWLFALLLAVFSAGCDRDHGGLLLPGGDPGPAGAVNLGTASTFGITAYDAITINNGHIYGDVALTQPAADGGTIASVPGAGVNDGGALGMFTSSVVTTSDGVTPGVITAADNGTAAKIAALPLLQADLNAAYVDLMGRAAPATPLTTPASAAVPLSIPQMI